MGTQQEPWLRGTLTEIDAVRRQVLHAFEQAEEDCTRWCARLSPEELEARPLGLPSVGFHMRHIVRSLDRLLTYLEGRQLSDEQLASMRSELTPDSTSRAEVFADFEVGMATAAARVKAVSPASYEEPRGVGRKGLQSTIGGLMVHCADHTQRHVGQMVTTAKAVVAMGANPANLN